MTLTTILRALAPALGCAAFFATDASAQDPARSDAAPGALEEEFFELIDDEAASANAAELLSWLHQNPIDLNRADRDELLVIPGLTSEDAEAILRLRESKGHMASIEDVGKIPGGGVILARIRPYAFVYPTASALPSSRVPTVEFSSRLSGILPGGAVPPSLETLGNSTKSLSRVGARISDHVNAGFLFEKDAGERMHDGFLSGYISFHGAGAIEQAVLGDFSAEAGQGLVLCRGTNTGRSGDLVGGIRRPGARLLPYHLAGEAQYLRGGAIALKSKIWTLPLRCLLLASRTSLAATLNEQGEVATFYASGLYETAAELQKRNAVHEFLAGAHLEYGHRGATTIGLTYYRSSFDRTVQPLSSFGFSGDRSQVMGADVNINVHRASLFGEVARTQESGIAWIAGAVLAFDSTLKGSIAYRDYPDGFNNPHAHAYGVQSNTSNERGIEIGWCVQLARGFVLRGFADQCKIPRSTYSSLLPRMASDFLVEVTALPMPGMRVSLAYRTRKTESMQHNVQAGHTRGSGRFTGRMDISSHLEMNMRFEHGASRFAGTHQAETGSLLSQTFRYSPGWMEWEGGVAFFDTDSYDARLYDFEGNLRGSIPSPALYGRGSRWHLLFSWFSFPAVRIVAKYAHTVRERSPCVKDLAVQVEVRY